jgi:hypothetical protein
MLRASCQDLLKCCLRQCLACTMHSSKCGAMAVQPGWLPMRTACQAQRTTGDCLFAALVCEHSIMSPSAGKHVQYRTHVACAPPTQPDLTSPHHRALRRCPLDHVFDLEGGWAAKMPEEEFGPHIEFREHSFLANHRLPVAVNQSKVVVEMCPPGTAGCSDGTAPAAVEVRSALVPSCIMQECRQRTTIARNIMSMLALPWAQPKSAGPRLGPPLQVPLLPSATGTGTCTDSCCTTASPCRAPRRTSASACSKASTQPS